MTSPGPNYCKFQYNLRRIKALHRETVFTILSIFFNTESDTVNNSNQWRSPLVSFTSCICSSIEPGNFFFRKLREDILNSTEYINVINLQYFLYFVGRLVHQIFPLTPNLIAEVENPKRTHRNIKYEFE